MKPAFSFFNYLLFDVYYDYSRFDLSKLHQIEKDCFSSKFRLSKKDLAQEFKSCSKNELLVIFKQGKTPAGFIMGEQMNEQGYIASVNVAPNFRKLGLGKRLLSLMELLFEEKGYTESHLEVNTENVALILYLKTGYKIRSLTPNYYCQGEHALSMCKPI